MALRPKGDMRPIVYWKGRILVVGPKRPVYCVGVALRRKRLGTAGVHR